MNIRLSKSQIISNASLTITGSKSETNRLLLLQALFPNFQIEKISNSDDSEVMLEAIKNSTQNPKNPIQINVHHAGTAMRFLTAFFAIQENCEVILNGSKRMQERPIKILVEALRELGAAIFYENQEGYPPLKIIGKNLKKNKVTLAANISSQYISALLLIAPKLENGLELILEGEITSVPYIQMTLALLNEIGVETSFERNIIKVKKFQFTNSKFQTQNSKLKTPNSNLLTVESDWSSASYFYSIVALSNIGAQITLSNYKKNSLQGDAVVTEIYQDFGVETIFSENSISIKKTHSEYPKSKIINLKSSPDIAQTIAVTCFGLGVSCHFTGLHTLKIKETDRLEALRNELTKLGAHISVTDDSLILEISNKINENIAIKTYQDHRMAMAFAPLAIKTPIIIEEAEVVSKSYPTFWEDLQKIGFKIEKFPP
ncbi:3-phosphoshikimate 1-carboxyvinyltransferase [Flavobacterium sp. NST-5]|uniref:3-phosphoshikimate 1-carboxyvinyltransferase n=1 Tax=Flavobacterium ichthyis TaxID=2698827 RepID=A0ABW9Z4J5_9FLAO|nr:3-phosphoshikimate 1-carboxyvinyltransferase [Flavobacterium ichthyis]NBL63758.1 3-phosphoshikimate 1-carboxyvinyltransferase [Flavobacterium ichthyis]